MNRFVFDQTQCIKCDPGMVSGTVTKLTRMNQNITIGSKNDDWVRSFRFWPESVHRFVYGPNQCIKCNHVMVFDTVTKLTKINKNITLGPKMWIGCVRFISSPN